MKRSIAIAGLIVFWFGVAHSCKKPDNNNINGGGKGGHGIIAVTPEAHSVFLDSCTVYIRYASLDAPADGVYDDSILYPLPFVNGSIPVAVFRNLKAGSYYLFAKGVHPGYSPPSVKGGKGYVMNTEDSGYVIVPTYSY